MRDTFEAPVLFDTDQPAPDADTIYISVECRWARPGCGDAVRRTATGLTVQQPENALWILTSTDAGQMNTGAGAPPDIRPRRAAFSTRPRGAGWFARKAGANVNARGKTNPGTGWGFPFPWVESKFNPPPLRKRASLWQAAKSGQANVAFDAVFCAMDDCAHVCCRPKDGGGDQSGRVDMTYEVADIPPRRFRPGVLLRQQGESH